MASATAYAAAGFSLASLDGEPLPSAQDRTSQTLYLDIIIDERLARPLVRFNLIDDRLWVEPAELTAAGLALPSGLTPDAHGRVALDDIAGLPFRYEPAMQRVVLMPSRNLRPTRTLGYRMPAPVAVQRDHGLVFEYDAYARSIGDQQTLSLGTGLRWFGRYGSLEATGVSRGGDGGGDAYDRLDTRWSYSDPDRMWTWTAGDLISGGLTWTRPVRMGGVQWRRNFGVRPDLVVYPMPQFSADATVPSSVELYVNNVRQYAGQVDPGPFVLNEFPRVVGAGQAVVVVTDALGRTTQTSVPLYTDYQRLAEGLSDFSFEAGVLRSGYGSDHDDYGSDIVANASWRRGLSDEFTIELHGESGPSLKVAGAGMAWSPLGRYGVINAAYATSNGDGIPPGHQNSVGYQWFGQLVGFDLYRQRGTHAFRDLGSLDAGGAPLREQDRASMWLSVPRGSLSLTWLRYRDAEDAPSRTFSVGLSQSFGRYAYVSANAFDDDRAGRGVSMTVSVPLGRDHDASLSIDRQDGRNNAVASVRRSVPYEGGWGWQALARDSGDGQFGTTWRGNATEIWMGVDRVDGDVGAFAQGSGSVVWMDGQVFASRRISDAFAVVSTNGVADVPILYENRTAGRTNRAGYLLLPELRGWQANRIAIDPDGLPANVEVPAIERLVTPADHAGIQLHYALNPLRTATLVLHETDGTPVAAGTRVHRTEGTAIVGFDGELWLDRYVDGETLQWNRAGQGCSVTLPPLPASAAQSRTLACQPKDSTRP